MLFEVVCSQWIASIELVTFMLSRIRKFSKLRPIRPNSLDYG